jgi:transcriptional regulator with XRE-family HTH domain
MTANGESVGARLRRLRETAGHTQESLARAARVPLGSLRNWEQDVRLLPRLDLACRLAVALGCTLGQLAGSEPLPAGGGGRPKQGRKGKGGKS